MDAIQGSMGNFLVNAFGDRYLYRINRNAFNRIGSDSLYSSLYGQKLFHEFQLNIIVGTDSGLLPAFIAKRGVPAGSRYIFIELPEILEALSLDRTCQELPQEISVTTMDNFKEESDEYRLSDYAFLDAVHVIESVGSRDANMPEYRELSWDLSLTLNTMLHSIVTSANNFPFIMRQFENLTENQNTFSGSLKDAFAGRTAIILAGGPSLTEALPWVKKNRDRLVIVAVSRISRTLLNAGIIPHIIASVDPTILSFEISREMFLLAGTPDPPLFVASYHVTSLLAGQWPAKFLYTGPLFPWHTDLNTDDLLYHGPTVSNFAISLCKHMGCKTIVLAGVNNCFSAEGQTHAAGSNESKVGPDLGQMATRIETYGGSFAETNQSFISSIGILQLQAQEIAEKGINIYNCSPNAAKVPFIEYKAFQEIDLADSAVISTSKIFKRRLPESTVEARLAHYANIKKEIDLAHTKLLGILKLSREALKCTDGLFGRNGMKRDFRYKIKMDKIERKLDNFGQFSLLVKQCGIKRFLLSLKTTMSDSMTDDQIESATRGYYETYLEGTKFLIKRMKETSQRIQARIEEDSKAPSVQKLADQWKKDQQFGRVHVWRQRHPEKEKRLTDKEREILVQLEQEFSRVMKEERTTHIMHLENVHDLKHTRSKALLLYKRQKVTDLQAMAKGLGGHPNQEKALCYLHFVDGLLAELADDPARAIAHYQELFTNPPHLLTEDALLQVAQISIAQNDTASALLAIECLVGISPPYLRPYAELLKAMGDFEAAFTAYNRYIGVVPDDVGAVVSLGMLCKEAGLDDAAAELFRRALDKDANNGAASTMLLEISAAHPPLAAS